MYKNFLAVLIPSLLLALATTNNANAASGNVDVRAEGVGVSVPDTINGHYAMVLHQHPIKFVFSAESDFAVTGASLGWWFYSPDFSILSISHGGLEKYPAWDTAFNLPAPGYTLQDWDGILPDTFITGGAALGPSFGPTALVDIFALNMSFPDDTSGVFCIDTTFVPPAGPWLFSNGQTANPTWGGSAGGYPNGGYCITIYQGCCLVPGDADHGGDVNISDATFIEKYIFRHGPPPPCLEDADANGGGDINIGDVTFLVKYIFRGGAAPSCAP